MRKNPLAVVCVLFCLGIWVAKIARVPFLFSYPPDHIANFVSDSPQKVSLQGEVASFPEVSLTLYRTRRSVFTFRVKSLAAAGVRRKVQGAVKVTLYGERDVSYGDELFLEGSLARAEALRNPGGFDYREYLANHRIFGLLKVREKDAVSVERQGHSAGVSGLETLLKFRERLRRVIHTHLEPKQAVFLSAILLGERTGLPQDTKELFINTGTVHILAISGLHIGLIAFLTVTILRFLRLPRTLTYILTILFLIVYAFFAGARPSVVRATIMAVIVLTGLLINREPRIYNSLGLAALIILIFNPRYLFDAGFQLSFLSVISVIYFSPRIQELFPLFLRKGVGGYFSGAFSVSLGVWLGIAPLTALYFNIVSPVTVLANLIIIPCLFLVVSMGLCFLIFALLWAPLGAIFAQSCWLSLVCLEKLVTFIAAIPHGFWHSPAPGVLFFIIYYAVILLIFNRRKLNIPLGKLAIGLALLANILIYRPLFYPPSDKLKITFLDAGHGDAIFIQFPCSGGTMLIDGGRAGAKDTGRRVILPFLWERGIDKIDAVVLTHSDDDHLGGLLSVMEDIRVNYVFDNGIPRQTAAYNRYRQLIKERGPCYRVIKQGDRIFGYPSVKLITLFPEEKPLTGTKSDENNNSLVMKIVYKDVGIIFCGDIQKEGMNRILRLTPALKSTVIKVPHHGSFEGRVQGKFFQAVFPSFAVISVDRNNRYGFPAREAVQGLENAGAQVYTTADNGAIIFSTDGQEVFLETMLEKGMNLY